VRHRRSHDDDRAEQGKNALHDPRYSGKKPARAETSGILRELAEEQRHLD
jgi:hypothetical protein